MSKFLHLLTRFCIVSSLIIANLMVEVILLFAAIIGGGYLLSLKASNASNSTLLFTAFLLLTLIVLSNFLVDTFQRWSNRQINCF